MSAGQTRAFMRCPHCESGAVVRTSYSLTSLLRESFLQCKNVVCGHTFSAYTEIVKTLSPSSCPNPTVDLPIVGQAERESYKLKYAQAQAAYNCATARARKGRTAKKGAGA